MGIRVGGLDLVEIHVVCLLSTDSFVLYLFYLRGALYYLHKSPVLKFLHPKPRRNDDNMLFGFMWRNILCQGVVMPFECFFALYCVVSACMSQAFHKSGLSAWPRFPASFKFPRMQISYRMPKILPE